ncbi:MAG: tryptophan-rich sensory protein [Brevundimonas sp.]|nr:MAG: tryptophan-rich sensory protein [Brevundimonas sp.]
MLKTISLRTGWPLLAIFIAGVIGAGLAVGLIAAPPEGYLETLRIPDAIIPPAISGPLWFALAFAFAVAGWRLWTIDPRSIETRIWLAIQILSWWFAPAFFVMRAPSVALLVICALSVLMLWFILSAWNRDRLSAYLFIPCLLYVAYTATMTAAIVAMN